MNTYTTQPDYEMRDVFEASTPMDIWNDLFEKLAGDEVPELLALLEGKTDDLTEARRVWADYKANYLYREEGL